MRRKESHFQKQNEKGENDPQGYVECLNCSSPPHLFCSKTTHKVGIAVATANLCQELFFPLIHLHSINVFISTVCCKFNSHGR